MSANRQGARWTPLEERRLRETWQRPAHAVALELGRSVGAVRIRRTRLGLRAPERAQWSAADDRLVRELLSWPLDLVAEALGRTVGAVRKRRWTLGLRPRRGEPRRFSALEDRRLRRMVLEGVPRRAIAIRLGRPPSSVGARIRLLRIA